MSKRLHIGIAVLVGVLFLSPNLRAGKLTYKNESLLPRSGVIELLPDVVIIWSAEEVHAKTGEEELDINRQTHKVRRFEIPLSDVGTIDGISPENYRKVLKLNLFYRAHVFYQKNVFIFKAGVGWMGQIKVVLVLLVGFFGLLPLVFYFGGTIFKTGDTSVAGSYFVSIGLTILFSVAIPLNAKMVQASAFFQKPAGAAVFSVAMFIAGLVAVMAILRLSFKESFVGYLFWLAGFPGTLWLISKVQPGLASLGGG